MELRCTQVPRVNGEMSQKHQAAPVQIAEINETSYAKIENE